MADEFKTFDKAPIVGVVNIKHWSFAVREIILAVISMSLLVLCLIFVGLYANSKSDSVENVSSPAAIVQKQFCVNRDCMNSAARSIELMNTSVDPCDNFYEYACGNYKLYNPITRQAARSVVADMKSMNLDHITDIISRPPVRAVDWSYERKMSHFYQSCVDSYEREKLGGRPLLEKVIPQLGGWDLLGTWNEAMWSLNDALKKVQTDFWVDAFYAPNIEPDANDRTQRVITLRPAGVGKWMYVSWYTSPYSQKQRNDYKKFIRRVGSLLMRDAKLVNVSDSEKEDRLNTFVNDTFFMESKIAHVTQNSRYRVDPYDEENKVTLTQLNRETGIVIDWVDQISHLFNDAGVTGFTNVVVLGREYFRNLTNMITSLPTTERKRLLHNYLIWRVAEIYVQDLSWEYVHANREIFVDTQGYKNFAGMTQYCMYLTRYYMKYAVGALYVQQHLADESKQKVISVSRNGWLTKVNERDASFTFIANRATDITMNLKKALKEQLEKTPWMDDQTRTFAKNKLDKVTFKLGYPDWMTNVDYIDNLYDPFNVNISDFFDNLLSSNTYQRKQWNKKLRFGEDKEEWIFQPYDTTISVYYYWNEIIAPAGILQEPIWNHNAQHFTTFGSIGGFLARYLHYIIDEWGAHYNMQGDIMGQDTWWTNKSITAYRPVRQCVLDQYRNITQNVTWGHGPPLKVSINYRRYIPSAIAITSGVRLALKGYKDWTAGQATEKMLPGLAMSPQQMIFLSYAQSHCFNRNEIHNTLVAFRGQVGEDIQVNMALGQLQEFSDTFQCPVDSKMNHKTKCTYY